MASDHYDGALAPIEQPVEGDEGDAAATGEGPFDSDASSMEDGEATEDAEAVEDADVQLATMDAETLLDAYVADDASDGGSSPVADAADSEGGAPPSDAGLCSRASVDVWRAAHLKSDIRDQITRCRIDCDSDVACADLCLRREAGVVDCNPCTRAEAECSGPFCSYACLPSRTDQTCLACLCQADCIAAFESCAGERLALCPPELFTFSAAPAGPALDTAALLIGKSTTGTLSVDRFDATAGLLSDESVSINHFPSGAVKLVPLSLPDRELVFQYSTNCNAAPCTVRAYPVLRDGSFGRPVFEERWDAGYVDLESFVFAGQHYLVRLHESAGSTVANVLIDRFDWNAETQLLQREAAVRTTLLPASSSGYSRVEPFSLGNETFLFLLAPESGEATVARVQTAGTGMELSVAADPMTWSRGWDIIEGFKSFGRFYVLAYKSGLVATDQEPVGQTRIWQPRLDAQGRVSLDPPVFDEPRGGGTTHILSFTDASGFAYLALHQAALGRLDLHRLEADPARWHEDFLVPQQTQSRGHTPPWDVLGLVRNGRW